MEPKVIIFGTAVMLILVVGIVSFVLIYMKRQQQQQLEVAKLNEIHQKDLLIASVDAQENVRRQIGGDLHDDIGTLLSATRLSLLQLGKQIKEKPDIGVFYSQTNELLDEAIGNVRRISKDLMPSTLDEFGLQIALKEFSEKLTTTTGIQIDFQSNGLLEDKYPQKVELVLFRITQELINNSLKHASPSRIDIELSQQDQHLLLSIQDDGAGFDLDEVKSNPKRGVGIRNIESRLSVMNGRVLFDVAKGKGSVILVDINLSNL